MNFTVPPAATHPSVAKEQHLVPRTYMRQWSYNGGDSIWVVEKSKLDMGIHSKNVDKINFKVGFHDIKAGDIFVPDEALTKIFGFLTNLDIECDQKKLTTLKEINSNFYRYEEWIIRDSDGNVATRKEKNEIFRVLSQSRYTFIEEEWCYQFEDQLISFITGLEAKIRCKVTVTPPSLSKSEYEKLMEYLLIFDFRNEKGNSYVNDAINIFPMDIFDDIDISPKERSHAFNKTGGDELRHAIRISSFYKYLTNRKGTIKQMVDNYLNNFGIGIYLTSSAFPFVTSELSSLIVTRPDGLKEHIFVATPTMLITTFKDPVRGHGFIENIRPKDVRKYNKRIAAESNTVIMNRNDFNIHKLLS